MRYVRPDKRKCSARHPARGEPFWASFSEGRAHEPHQALITTRDKSGEGETHAAWNDFIVVQEGEASFTLGGTLTGAREVGPGEVRSSGVTGGRTVTLRSGDYIFAPTGTAHRMEVPTGGKVRYIVFKTRK